MSIPHHPPLRIRPARESDAVAIRLVATSAWTATYKSTLAPENIAQFLRTNYGLDRVTARLQRENVGTFVVERMIPPQSGEIIGFSFCGQHILGNGTTLPAEGELYAIYVRPDALAVGAGFRLWSESVDWLRQRHYQRMWIGVLTNNQRARDFYERQSARLDHVEDVVLGTQTLPEAWYRADI